MIPPVFPTLIELTPNAAATCARDAAARGVTADALISGCMVIHLLRQSLVGASATQVGALMVSLEGIALRIRTVEEFAALPVPGRDTLPTPV